MTGARRRLFHTGTLIGILLMVIPPAAGSGKGKPDTGTPTASGWEALLAHADGTRLKGDYPHMDCFSAAAEKYSIPLVLLLAVARGESNFDPLAKSSRQCLGIMQIRWPGTASDLGIKRKEDLFDPCINIDAGARYLSWLLKRFDGDVHLAVAAYNYGPNAVRAGHIPDGAEGYAAYIQRHLTALITAAREDTGRTLIVGFTYYHTAEDFVRYLKRSVQGVPFEIFKSPAYTYDVYVTFKTVAEKKDYLMRLKNRTGIEPSFPASDDAVNCQLVLKEDPS